MTTTSKLHLGLSLVGGFGFYKILRGDVATGIVALIVWGAFAVLIFWYEMRGGEQGAELDKREQELVLREREMKIRLRENHVNEQEADFLRDEQGDERKGQ